MIKIKLLNNDAKPPVRGSDKAAGLDLRSVENAVILPGVSATLKTGLSISVGDGNVGLIWPRSKLGAKKNIQVLAGVIDSDYRGEVMIALLNSGDRPFEVFKGDKIAQLIIQQCDTSEYTIVESLDETDRGSDGINSDEMRIR
jgi:dUTP pyrophosphatase